MIHGKDSELWLIEIDGKKKYVKKHIRQVSQNDLMKLEGDSNTQEVCRMIDSLNNKIEFVDSKLALMVMTNIKYALQGIEELNENSWEKALFHINANQNPFGSSTPKVDTQYETQLKQNLFLLENRLPELIEFVNLTLSWNGVNITFLSTIVRVIIRSIMVIAEQNIKHYSTVGQKQMIVASFLKMLNKYNALIEVQIRNIENRNWFVNMQIPPSNYSFLQINWNNITTANYVAKIRSEKISIDDIDPSTEKFLSYGE